MILTKLLISAKNGNEKYLSYPITAEAPIYITYQLADVRNPEQRKGSRSLTIKLLGTNEINKLFENIFSVNVSTQYFNKNLKTPVKYIVDGLENLKGDLQLLAININSDNSIEYECSILGERGSLFIDLGDKLLSELDFSDYDHTYDRAIQISTRSNLGSGLDVLYPFVDNGTNNGSDTVWNVSNFLPCFSFYEYIKKIIEGTGRTFTSTILSSSLIKNSILYPNLNQIVLSSSQLANRQFYVGLTTDVNMTINAPFVNVNFNNETGSFFDVGNQVSGTYAILNDSGYYNVAALDYYKVRFTHSDPSVVKCKVGFQTQHGIEKSGNGGANYFYLTNNAIDFKTSNGTLGDTDAYLGKSLATSTDYYFNNQLATGEMFFSAGDRIRTKSYLGYASGGVPVYYDASNNVVSTGTATWTLELLGNTGKTSFYALATKKVLLEGNTIEVNNALPVNIKQKDFLKSVIQALNLFIDIDPADENNLIIEDFDTFYNTTDPIDYRNRTDLSKQQVINPNLLEGKQYIFTYKEDNDKFNVQYKETHKEVFGTQTVEVENDFIKEIKKNELLFSATPNAANYGLGIAHPRIYTEEGLTKKTIVPNVRWLYVGGVKQTTNPYTYKQTGLADLITNDYLYAGHTDDPFNPTLDLNFGLPKEVYYNFINTYFTNNNLYNRFHSKYLNNLINRDGKFVTKYLWLSPRDIYNFSFRNRLFIDGAYYIVNKIENYNPLSEQSTKCELIKLLESDVFSPTSYLISSNTGVSAGSGVLSARLNSGLNVGSNIQNRGTNCIAVGDNIIIPESCSNVTVIGNNVVVNEGLSNISVINTNDLEVTQSNISINNGIIVTDNFRYGYVETTDATPTKLVFDTFSGEFDINLDNSFRIEAKIIAVDANTLDTKEWVAQGIVKNNSIVSYDVIEAVTSTFSDAGISSASISITPGAFEYLDFTATGIAATLIYWKCNVEYVRIVI